MGLQFVNILFVKFLKGKEVLLGFGFERNTKIKSTTFYL